VAGRIGGRWRVLRRIAGDEGPGRGVGGGWIAAPRTDRWLWGRHAGHPDLAGPAVARAGSAAHHQTKVSDHLCSNWPAHACMSGGAGAYHGEMSPPSLPDRRSGRPTPGGTGGPSSGGPGGQTPSGSDQSWRWVFALLIVAVIAVLIVPALINHPQVKKIPYKTYLQSYVE